MNFIECTTLSYTRAGVEIANNPVNLDRIISFCRGLNISQLSSDRSVKPAITFLTGYDKNPVQWVFDNDDDRNAAYDYLVSAVVPQMLRFK